MVANGKKYKYKEDAGNDLELFLLKVVGEPRVLLCLLVVLLPSPENTWYTSW